MSESKDTNGAADDADPDVQRFLLARAKAAGTDGDEKGMLKPLVESRILDGLRHRLAARLRARSGRDCDHDDLDAALEQAVTTLFEKLSGGDQIRDIAAFLYRVAERRAVDLHRLRRREVRLEPSTIGAAADDNPSILDKLAREETDNAVQDDPEATAATKRRNALRVVRRLLPEMKLARSQEVISYIFDAMEGGAEEVTNDQISDALGISAEAVRKARERGFARLKKLAIENGYSTGPISCIPDSDALEDDNE
jgi:RNA polymerase sigma factor (sigma-70 family)